MKFYVCPICGNVVELINGDSKHITCCGKEMKELTANSVDAAFEKHVPFVEEKDGLLVVSVGEVLHPMEEDHYIMWVAFVKDDVITRVNFRPGEEPVADFPVVKDATVYAYCDKHGLWKKEI